MSLNILIDTVFVGRWIGSEAIAAIDLSLPSANSLADPAVSAETICLNFLLYDHI